MIYIVDLWTFALAVINNWAGYSTGGVLVASVVLWKTLKGKTLPRNVALGLAAVFLLLAFFRAWDDEYRKTQPGLHVAILQALIAPSSDGPYARLLITASISNVGSPTMSDTYQLLIKRPTNDSWLEFKPLAFPLGKPITISNLNGDDRTFTYDPADALYSKTASTPISTGGKETGLLMFVLKELTYQEAATPGTIYRLKCSDVNNNEVFGDYTWKGTPTPFLYYPGMRTPDIH